MNSRLVFEAKRKSGGDLARVYPDIVVHRGQESGGSKGFLDPQTEQLVSISKQSPSRLEKQQIGKFSNGERACQGRPKSWDSRAAPATLEVTESGSEIVRRVSGRQKHTVSRCSPEPATANRRAARSSDYHRKSAQFHQTVVISPTSTESYADSSCSTSEVNGRGRSSSSQETVDDLNAQLASPPAADETSRSLLQPVELAGPCQSLSSPSGDDYSCLSEAEELERILSREEEAMLMKREDDGAWMLEEGLLGNRAASIGECLHLFSLNL